MAKAPASTPIPAAAFERFLQRTHPDWAMALKRSERWQAVWHNPDAWVTWVLKHDPAIPDAATRRAIMQTAQTWVQQKITRRADRLAPKGAARERAFLWRVMEWHTGHVPSREWEQITQNPYTLAAIPPVQTGIVASDATSWWTWIDRLGQRTLAHQDYAPWARRVGAVVFSVTLNEAQRGGTIMRMPLTRRADPRTLVYQIAKRLNPANPDREIPYVRETLEAMESGRLSDLLPVPYTLTPGDRLRVTRTPDGRMVLMQKEHFYWFEVALANRFVDGIADVTDPGTWEPQWDAIMNAFAIPPLNTSQKQAIAAAWTRPVTAITGPAGSGKSTVIEALAALWRTQGAKAPFVVLTPTGKAAQRLAASPVFAAWPDDMQPQTIHRFLALTGNWPKTDEGSLTDWTEGWIVIDEASMVDTVTFGRLAVALKHVPVHLVLVGDARQIVPVGPGAPWIHAMAAWDTIIARGYWNAAAQPRVALVPENYRSGAARELANWARKLITPRDESVDWTPAGAVTAETTPTEDAWRQAIITWAQAQREKAQQAPDHTWQVLAPLRTEATILNETLQRAFFGDESAMPSQWPAGTRIRQNHNDYLRGLMNGQQGHIIARAEDGTLTAQFEGLSEPVIVDALYAETYWELAWAITVHKAQGSQWHAVLVTWGPKDQTPRASTEEGEHVTPPNGPPLAEPGLWYTAMTRAQSAMHIVSPEPLDEWLEPLRHQRDRSTDRKSRLKTLMVNRAKRAGRPVDAGQSTKQDAGPRGRLYRPRVDHDVVRQPEVSR